ncbi:hypothetical protein L1987_28544 [Smallanthus sonchifolius]|uniref:Uncharacterized protein n=1 Tax=Smallanthus sonchifolius TaxID=185202 RepID=A0ACB9HWX2_9ASTR|nr:hypothetical protein L1987_28544 [Smallanthus sonchifolius]
MIEPTREDNIRMGICLATLAMNFVALLSVFSQTGDTQHIDWKTIMFKLTGILSPYFAFSILLPKWFTWPGLAIICTIVIYIEGYNILQIVYNRCCQTIDFAKNYVIAKFKKISRDSATDEDVIGDNAV